MHEAGSARRKLVIAVLLAASLIPLWAAFKNGNSLTDDACITLCYAKNIARGNGFVFNCPPASLGTTTPLFALAVASISRAMPWAEIPKIAVIFSALCWVGIMWAFFFARRIWKLADWEAGVLGLTIAATGWIQFLGMEAYLFAFLLVVSLSLFLGGRYFLCGLTTGLLFLTRGEGVLVICILLAWSLFLLALETRKERRASVSRSALLALGFSLPAIAWFLYAHFEFGRFLPNTLNAKQAQLQSGLWKSFSERLVEDWIPSWGARFAPRGAPYLNAWWITVLIGICSALIERKRWLLWLAWAALYAAGYSAIAVSAYRWYQLPILFVLDIYLALGLIALARAAKKVANRAGGVVAVCLLSLCICSLGAKTIKMIRTYTEPKGESYRTLARWFRENSSPGESIAYIEIGYLGFYTDNCIVDLAGLLDPETIPHVSKGDFAWGFWKHEPRYFVYLEDFGWALDGIISDPRFRQVYIEAASLRGPRESNLVIFEKSGPR